MDLFDVSICLSLLFYFVEGRTAQVVVKTNSGPLRGFKVLAGRLEIAVFRGIPYAQAPTGQRRLKPPEQVPQWTDIFDALNYGATCVQNSGPANNGSVLGKEDCLTLNVFKPMLFDKENTNIPVIIMPHTGNFISGSSQDINGVELAKSLEAIIVTMNYRLGIFGFYSLEGHVKSNLGIRDQIQAIQWAKENIKYFNGNSNNILLIADHIMTNLHLMSPTAKELFNRAISYDGESYMMPKHDFTFQIQTQRLHLEKYCGKLEETKEIPVEHNVWVCLRRLPVEDIARLTSDLTDGSLIHPFRPVYDNEVIIPDLHITSSFLHCDYMAFKSHLHIPGLNVEVNNTACRDYFTSISSLVAKDKYSGNVKLIQKIINSHYFPTYFNHSYNFCESVFELLNDIVTSEIISFANHHSRTGLTFLNFVDGVNSSVNSPVVEDRVPGGDISCILTNGESSSCSIRNQTVKAGIINAVRTFLYHGYPTVNPSVVWRPYTTSSRNYLHTSLDTFRSGDGSNWPAERVERLWQDTLPVAASTDLSEGPTVQVLEHSVSLSWGLSEKQLEALVFSLILTCLVLFCVTLTLIRIVCFVNGKTFYNKKKQKPKKDIVLTDTKRRKDSEAVLSIGEIFRTNESISLNRRSVEQSDNDAYTGGL